MPKKPYTVGLVPYVQDASEVGVSAREAALWSKVPFFSKEAVPGFPNSLTHHSSPSFISGSLVWLLDCLTSRLRHARQFDIAVSAA
jgi:hypothetical protein